MNGVTFDCQGNNISGLGEKYGIYLYNSSSNTITNCVVSQFYWEIYLTDQLNNNKLINNTLNNNRRYGIYIVDSNNNTLAFNKINKSSGVLSLYTQGSYQFRNNISDTNTINGLPIQYYDGAYKQCPDNEVLSFNLSKQNISHLQLVGCSNVTIKNLNTTLLDGIHLSYTNNSRIENCISSDNYYGIYLSYSNNNYLANNTANSNSNGILLSYSNNNMIIQNIANNNRWFSGGTYRINAYNGIHLSSSNNNFISNNTIDSNRQDGIYFDISDNNTVLQNTINKNAYGVYFRFSYSNTIAQNIVDNNNYGICLFYSEGNTLYHNDLINKVQDGYDGLGSNSWDNGSEGNYWSDYKGTDSNGDGIGDIPYNISGGTNQDRYPLIEPSGGCSTKGDKWPCNGKVDDFELLNYIEKWVKGIVGYFNLLNAIDNWAKG